MKSLVCVSIDSVCVFEQSVLNWKGKDGQVRVGLIILYKFSAKCRLLLCRSFQMISTRNDDNYMYIKPMIEACREGMYFIVYKYNTCIKFALLRSSPDDRILWIRSGIEIKWLIEHVANGGQLLT